MKHYLAILLIGVLLLGCAQISPTETETTTENNTVEEKEPLSLSYHDEDFEERFQKTKPSDAALESLKKFSTKTYEALRKEDNSFYSPLSLYLALSMLKEGAQGESLKELSKLMGEAIDAQSLIEHLALNTEEAKVLPANSLWVQEDFSINKDYQDTLISKHYAAAYNRDLHKQETMDEISQWIYKKTKEKIKPDLEVDPEAALYLVNTLYLKAAWNTPFIKEATYQDIFHGIEDYKTDFMDQEESGEYFEDEQYKLAERALNYDLKIYFILPKEGKNLRDISYEKIFSDIEKTKDHFIKWSIPKVKMSEEMDLKKVLENLGIATIFSGRANFEKISKEQLFVSLIKQYTDLELDEDGVEAAAATIIGMTKGVAPTTTVEMKLDHPFGMIIMHRNIPLFIGEVYNPHGLEG